MTNKITFKNGFNAIFTGTISKTYFSKEENITHHQIINKKLIKKSKCKPFVINGINVVNISNEKTILDSHII